MAHGLNEDTEDDGWDTTKFWKTCEPKHDDPAFDSSAPVIGGTKVGPMSRRIMSSGWTCLEKTNG
jgi:hypothetical protein